MHPAHRYMLFLKEAYSTFILFFERVANIQKVSADNISPQETIKKPSAQSVGYFLMPEYIRYNARYYPCKHGKDHWIKFSSTCHT